MDRRVHCARRPGQDAGLYPYILIFCQFVGRILILFGCFTVFHPSSSSRTTLRTRYFAPFSGCNLAHHPSTTLHPVLLDLLWQLVHALVRIGLQSNSLCCSLHLSVRPSVLSLGVCALIRLGLGWCSATNDLGPRNIVRLAFAGSFCSSLATLGLSLAGGYMCMEMIVRWMKCN